MDHMADGQGRPSKAAGDSDLERLYLATFGGEDDFALLTALRAQGAKVPLRPRIVPSVATYGAYEDPI